MKSLKITHTFKTLSEAVAEAKPDLSYNDPEARRFIKDTDRRVKQAVITEDGEIWYVYACDIDVLHKFDPFISCLTSYPFQVAFIVGDWLIFTGKFVQKDKAGRKWFATEGRANGFLAA